MITPETRWRGRWALLGGAPMLIALVGAPAAQAQMFSPNREHSFCKLRPPRETIVYIQDNLMRAGHVAWARSLEDKLDGSLMPGEKVTVVQLSPQDGTAAEVWSGCWPNYSVAQRRKIKKKTYIFSASPLRSLKKYQKIFLNQFGRALTKIYAASIKADRSKRGIADHGKSMLLEALSSDGARYSSRDDIKRVIVYSNLYQNSSEGSDISSPAAAGANYGEILGTYFRNAIFYVYGVQSPPENPGYEQLASRFWKNALSSMHAAIGGIGADLNIQNIVPVRGMSIPVVMTHDTVKLYGSLNLLVSNDGDLVDSFLRLSRLGAIAITGTYRCGSKCSLKAQTLGPFTSTTSDQESLDMTENRKGVLSGEEGVIGTYSFPIEQVQSPK